MNEDSFFFILDKVLNKVPRKKSQDGVLNREQKT